MLRRGRRKCPESKEATAGATVGASLGMVFLAALSGLLWSLKKQKALKQQLGGLSNPAYGNGSFQRQLLPDRTPAARHAGYVEMINTSLTGHVVELSTEGRK